MCEVGLFLRPGNIELQKRVMARLSATADVQLSFTATSLKMLGAVRRALKLDALVIDIGIAGPEGLSRELWDQRSRLGGVPMVVVYDELSDVAMKSLFTVGVQAHVAEATLEHNLLPAIRRVAEREVYLDGEGVAQLLPSVTNGDASETAGKVRQRYNRLTEREREVFQLLSDGLPLSAVAEHLCVSAKTVQSHRGRLFKKMKITCAVELLGCAMLLGLTKLDVSKGGPTE